MLLLTNPISVGHSFAIDDSCVCGSVIKSETMSRFLLGGFGREAITAFADFVKYHFSVQYVLMEHKLL